MFSFFVFAVIFILSCFVQPILSGPRKQVLAKIVQSSQKFGFRLCLLPLNGIVFI